MPAAAPKSNTALPNPYGDIFPPEEFAISKRAAWALAVLFLLIIGIPPLVHDFRILTGKSDEILPARDFFQTITAHGDKTPPITQRLKAFETRLNAVSYTRAPRQFAQQQITRWLGLGNSRVFVAEDGMLYYKPELRIHAGYNAFNEPPPSPYLVKDAGLHDWQPPAPVIREFAEQLQERGIRLEIIVAPMKVIPSGAAPIPEGVVTPGWHAHYQRLLWLQHATGFPLFFPSPPNTKTKPPGSIVKPPVSIFVRHFDDPDQLRQDTHTAPSWLQVCDELSNLERPLEELETRKLQRSSRGDLVEKLDLPIDSGLFEPEQAELTQVIDRATGLPVEPNRDSPILMLGDSFVNIYDDPTLGFGPAEKNGRIGAGFAAEVSAKLKHRIDWYAVNGGGPSEVREWFARQPDEYVRKKKVVIWVIAERDLFMPRALARKNNVEWRRVTFAPPSARPPAATGTGELVIEATLLEASEKPNPKTAPYAQMLYLCKYRIDKVVTGTFEEQEIYVAHWLFRQREYSKTAHLEVGKKFTLTPVLKDQSSVSNVPMSDTLDVLEAMYFSETAEPLP